MSLHIIQLWININKKWQNSRIETTKHLIFVTFVQSLNFKLFADEKIMWMEKCKKNTSVQFMTIVTNEYTIIATNTGLYYHSANTQQI